VILQRNNGYANAPFLTKLVVSCVVTHNIAFHINVTSTAFAALLYFFTRTFTWSSTTYKIFCRDVASLGATVTFNVLRNSPPDRGSWYSDGGPAVLLH